MVKHTDKHPINVTRTTRTYLSKKEKKKKFSCINTRAAGRDVPVIYHVSVFTWLNQSVQRDVSDLQVAAHGARKDERISDDAVREHGGYDHLERVPRRGQRQQRHENRRRRPADGRRDAEHVHAVRYGLGEQRFIVVRVGQVLREQIVTGQIVSGAYKSVKPLVSPNPNAFGLRRDLRIGMRGVVTGDEGRRSLLA